MSKMAVEAANFDIFIVCFQNVARVRGVIGLATGGSRTYLYTPPTKAIALGKWV